MAKNKYSKRDLNRFRKTIQEKIDELTGNMDDIRDDLNNNTKGNSVSVQLVDEKGNRFCLGCTVIIRYGKDGERHQMREIKTGGGFHSYDAPVAHFGLGQFETIQQMEVTWSTGETSILKHSFSVNREYIIHRQALEGNQ